MYQNEGGNFQGISAFSILHVHAYSLNEFPTNKEKCLIWLALCSANYRHEIQLRKSRKRIEKARVLTSPTRDDKLKAINHRQKSLQNTIKWNKQDRTGLATWKGKEETKENVGKGDEKKCHCQLNAGDFVWPLCATMWVINVICG